MSLESSSPVFIVYEKASWFRDHLEEIFPGRRFIFVESADDLPSLLEEYRPEVAFSIKGPGFPPEGHKPLTTFPSLKWIQVGGSGFDHLIPLDFQRLTVTNCAGVLSRYLAEMVIGAIISLNTGLPTYQRLQQQKVWQPHSFRPLVGQNVLIVGLGQIGGWVAHNAKALGMNVVGIRRSNQPHPAVDRMHHPDALPDVIGEADFVSLHVRLSEETERMFDAEMLSRMKAGSFLINTSRGKVVDEQALLQAIASGHLAGAYLDVFEQEPLPSTSPLWSLENVVITPHAADDVYDWPILFLQHFTQNLTRWDAGQPLEKVVRG